MSTSNSTLDQFKNIKIHKETHKGLKIASSIMDIRIQDLVEEILSRWVNNYESIQSGNTQLDSKPFNQNKEKS